VLWVIISAILLFQAAASQPWGAHLVIDTFVGLLPLAVAWLLGSLVLTIKRWIKG
jgi:hypothetical protein